MGPYLSPLSRSQTISILYDERFFSDIKLINTNTTTARQHDPILTSRTKENPPYEQTRVTLSFTHHSIDLSNTSEPHRARDN